MQVPDEEWRALVAAIINVYTLRHEMPGGNWKELYSSILEMRRKLDAVVPRDSWGEFVPPTGRSDDTC